MVLFGFLVAWAVVAIVALRLRAGPIVAFGGGFLLAIPVALVLEPRRPPVSVDPAQFMPLVAGSDDFEIYKEAFAEAAARLIKRGECGAGDFTNQGGWMRSTTQRHPGAYFVFCGGGRLETRVFLTPQTGETYRSMK